MFTNDKDAYNMVPISLSQTNLNKNMYKLYYIYSHIFLKFDLKSITWSNKLSERFRQMWMINYSFLFQKS